MSEDDRKRLRKIGFWMNRINDAWSMGEANWAKDASGDMVSKIVNEFIEREDMAGGLYAVEAICKANGIDPKRHRWHGKG